MKNNLTKKILSAVLVLSVLLACACGNLLTASAAGKTYTVTFTVTAANGTEIPYGSLKAEMILDFTVDNAPANDGLSAATVEFALPNGVTIESYDSDNYSVITLDDSKTVLIDCMGAGYANLSVPITFTAPTDRGFIGGDVISVTAVEATASFESVINFTASGGTSLHVHDALGADAKCSVCGYENIKVSGKTASSDLGISGSNIVYDNNGEMVVNLHASAADNAKIRAYNDNGELMVWSAGYQNAGEEKYSITTDGTASSYAGNSVVAGTKLYTLKGISAKDITQNMRLVIESDTAYGATVDFSLGNYAKSVVAGNGVYPAGTFDAVKDADVDTAAALYYYGASVATYNGNSVSIPADIAAEIPDDYTDNTLFKEKYAEQKNDAYISNGGCSLTSVSVNTKTSPYLVLDFAFEEGKNATNVNGIIVSVDGTAITSQVTTDSLEVSGKRYRYRFTDMPARMMCSPITVQIGEVSGSYSAAGFAMLVIDANLGDATENVAKSLVCYSQMLAARYEADTAATA